MATNQIINCGLLAVLLCLTFGLYIFVKQNNTNTIKINEIRFNSADGVDWIELYNPTLNNLNLKSIYLSDKDSNFSKYRIDYNLTIPAGGFVMLYGDDSNIEEGMEVNFRISEGETVYLIASNGRTVLDSMTALIENAEDTESSIGRYPDGSEHIYMMTQPTPSQPNIRGYYANE